MIRTQLYIQRHVHQKLVLFAKQKGGSMADLVRRFIEDGLANLSKEKIVDTSGRDVMRSLANIHAKGGPKDLSKNIDHYLYGAPKKP